MINKGKPEQTLRKTVFEIALIWLSVFLFIGACATLVVLWGTNTPLVEYPLIFFRALLHPLVVALYMLVVGVYAAYAWWLRRKHRSGVISQ